MTDHPVYQNREQEAYTAGRLAGFEEGLEASMGLDQAWAAAEAALPEDWLGPGLTEDVPDRWVASTWCAELSEDGGYGHEDHIAEATAESPAAALHALAARLAELA